MLCSVYTMSVSLYLPNFCSLQCINFHVGCLEHYIFKAFVVANMHNVRLCEYIHKDGLLYFVAVFCFFFSAHNVGGF